MVADDLHLRLECLKHSIYSPKLNSSFRPLSGKPKGKGGKKKDGETDGEETDGDKTE